MQDNNIRTFKLRTISLQQALTLFLEELAGRNVSPATLTTYEGSLAQWFRFLEENDGTIESPTDLRRSSIAEYLAHLAGRRLSGMCTGTLRTRWPDLDTSSTSMSNRVYPFPP